jgi:signal transduction histidine kinase
VAAGNKRIGDIQKVIEHAVSQVRELSYELNPSIVERAGLQFALDRLVGRYRRNFEGSIRLLFDPTTRVPVQVATALYKIAEQALDNAVRHSGGGQVEILVRPAKGALVMEVRDNGVGMEPERAAPPVGLGFATMRYHADHAGLQFSVASMPGKGTIVKALYRTSESH